MRTQGFAATTTKSIAREAGLSEGTLYKHFTDKSELFLAVLRERLPVFSPRSVTGGPLRDSLVAVALAAIEFYIQAFPISASVFSDPALLAAQRDAMVRLDAGPRHPLAELADSLRVRQSRGDIRADADCAAAAALLLGACFQYAFLAAFEHRVPGPAELAAHAEAITDTLFAGL